MAFKKGYDPTRLEVLKGHRFMGNQYKDCNHKPVQKRKMTNADKQYFDKKYLGSIKDLYNRLNTSARQDNREVLITLEEFAHWKNSHPFICYYCNRLVFPNGHRADSATIDRMDNDKPYILSNIVVACLSCNSSKRKGVLPKIML